MSANAGGGLNDLVHTLPLLKEKLASRGISVTAFVTDRAMAALQAAGAMDGEVHAVKVNSPVARARWELWQFPRIVARERPAAVFQFSNLIFRKLCVPQITVLRSLTFFSHDYASQARRGVYQKIRYRVGCALSRKTIERAATVFCISQTQKDEIIRTYGELGEKVSVSHLGIEASGGLSERPVSRVAAMSELPQPLRNRLGGSLDGASHILLNVAHYYQHKNFLTLLKAIELLATSDPSVRAIITGGLVDYRGPAGEHEKQEIALARSLAARGILVDLGPVPKDWVYPLMHLADVFLFPSSLESFGHPLLEAMLTQTPIVASDTPIHREIAGDAAGYHQVYDPQSLADAITAALHNHDLRKRRVAAGCARVRLFTWERHVDELVEAIMAATGE